MNKEEMNQKIFDDKLLKTPIKFNRSKHIKECMDFLETQKYRLRNSPRKLEKYKETKREFEILYDKTTVKEKELKKEGKDPTQMSIFLRGFMFKDDSNLFRRFARRVSSATFTPKGCAGIKI